MSIPRLYLEDPLSEGAEIDAAPGQAHHLGVLRRGAGERARERGQRAGERVCARAAERRAKGGGGLTSMPSTAALDGRASSRAAAAAAATATKS
jgi:hypothetical protein